MHRSIILPEACRKRFEFANIAYRTRSKPAIECIRRLLTNHPLKLVCQLIPERDVLILSDTSQRRHLICRQRLYAAQHEP
jgi:hypothetical protein